MCMRVSVKRFLMPAGLGLAGLALAAAALPSVLNQPRGLWEVSRSATGARPTKICAPQTVLFAQWEHRAAQCTRTVVSSSPTAAVISYTCRSGDFGESRMRVITPRTLRIETQGISQGFPFNYVLHARRVGDC